MREKIRQMFPSTNHPQGIVTKEDPSVRDEVERVAIFGGKTRLVASSAIRQAAMQAGPSAHVRLPTHTPSPPHSHGITPPPAGLSSEHGQRWENAPSQAQSFSNYGVIEQSMADPNHPRSSFDASSFGQGPAQSAWPGSQIAQPFTEPYHYASSSSGGVDSTDFILNDTWTAFLQGHGVIPKIS